MRIVRDNRIAGYIACCRGRYVSAGRTEAEARRLAAAFGFPNVDTAPATIVELDDLNLSPWALGIVSGVDPWWRESEPEPMPRPGPGGSLYQPAREPHPVLLGHHGPMSSSRVHVYGPRAPGPPRPHDREYLGLGLIVGWLRRERIYIRGTDGDVPHFKICGKVREAHARGDVELPIVLRADSDRANPGLLPEYPRCPDCGEYLTWRTADTMPPSPQCAGCGSAFVDTRYRVAVAVKEKIMPSMQEIINAILEAMIEAQTEYYKWSGGWWSPENFITVSVYNKIKEKMSSFADGFYLTLENNIRHGIQQAGGFSNPGRPRNDIGGPFARFDIVFWNGDDPLPIEIKTNSNIGGDLEEICAVLTDTQINNGIVAFLTGAENHNTLRNKKRDYARRRCKVNHLQSKHHTKIKWVGENDYTYPYWGAVVLHISNHRTLAA